jgi:peptidyl-prolyl cis-trans isomerase C
MLLFRRFLPIAMVLALGILLASCQDKGGSSPSDIFPIFGNGAQDDSEVVAIVGDVKITQMDMDLHFKELVPRLQSRYEDSPGRQLLLKDMIDEVLLVLGAQDSSLLKRPEVIQDLTSQRREVMTMAMRRLGIQEGVSPSEEELKAYFEDNRKQFRQLGKVRSRHVECLTEQEANKVYELLVADGSPANFMKVAAEYSVNTASLAQQAEVGWYNRNGVIPFLLNGKLFTQLTFDLEMGLHPPIQVVDRWHVVEILERRPGRTMTFNEARKIVKESMLPAFYDGMVKDYLLEARNTYSVTRLGKYAPGQGLDVDGIMERASLVADPLIKLDFYRMVFTDFPDDDRADDALFMCALVSMDNFADSRTAMRYLDLLIAKYPESDLREDVVFLKKNMYNTDKLNPKSIEELRDQ